MLHCNILHSTKRRISVEITFIDKWSFLAENAFKASKELEDINSNALDKATENQINLSNAFFEANSKFFENLSESKRYPDLLANHNELLTTYSEVFSKAETPTPRFFAACIIFPGRK